MSKKPKVNVLPIEQGATPDPQNANKHTARGGALLENSLQRRGACWQLVNPDNAYVLISGSSNGNSPLRTPCEQSNPMKAPSPVCCDAV